MRGSFFIAFVVVPQRDTEAVVSLGIGTSLFGCIEDVRREIDSAGEDGGVAAPRRNNDGKSSEQIVAGRR